jgi:hypothetical protein
LHFGVFFPESFGGVPGFAHADTRQDIPSGGKCCTSNIPRSYSKKICCTRCSVST